MLLCWSCSRSFWNRLQTGPTMAKSNQAPARNHTSSNRRNTRINPQQRSPAGVPRAGPPGAPGAPANSGRPPPGPAGPGPGSRGRPGRTAGTPEAPRGAPEGAPKRPPTVRWRSRGVWGASPGERGGTRGDPPACGGGLRRVAGMSWRAEEKGVLGEWWMKGLRPRPPGVGNPGDRGPPGVGPRVRGSVRTRPRRGWGEETERCSNWNESGPTQETSIRTLQNASFRHWIVVKEKRILNILAMGNEKK